MPAGRALEAASDGFGGGPDGLDSAFGGPAPPTSARFEGGGAIARTRLVRPRASVICLRRGQAAWHSYRRLTASPAGRREFLAPSVALARPSPGDWDPCPSAPSRRPSGFGRRDSFAVRRFRAGRSICWLRRRLCRARRFALRRVSASLFDRWRIAFFAHSSTLAQSVVDRWYRHPHANRQCRQPLADRQYRHPPADRQYRQLLRRVPCRTRPRRCSHD